MGPQWITTVAQIVNFFILVFLLKRFLYRPIIDAMDEREATVASKMKDAEKKAEEANLEALSYKLKNEEIDKKKGELLAKAREEAERLRKTLFAEAREEIEADKVEWQKDFDSERASLQGDVRSQSIKHFNKLANKALKDLADTNLEEQMISVFLSKLADFSKAEKDDLKKAVAEKNKLQVISSFKPSAAINKKITSAVRKEIGNDKTVVEFKTTTDMACGIEMEIGGHSILWSLDNYLETLEEDLNTALVDMSVASTVA